MYKLVAIDIDGTLLNSKKELTPSVKKAVEDSVEKGCMIILCSGRSPLTLGVVKDMFKFDMPFACYNGGLVLKGKSGEVLYKKPLSKKEGIFILQEAKKRNISVNFWTMEGEYATTTWSKYADEYMEIAHYTKQPTYIDNNPEILDEEIAKMMWHDTKENIEDLMKECETIMEGRDISYATSQPIFIEFTDILANKAAAIENICEKFNIKQSETIAIGDGLNDIPMIKHAGLGVAMGNGKDIVKQSANITAPTNDEDGVAFILNKYVLGE